LGVLGTQSVSPAKTLLAQLMTVVYFGYFFAMPWYTRAEVTATPPERVTGRFISIPQLIGALLLIAAMVIIPLMLTNTAHASEASNVELMHVETSFEDKGSLQRGWGTYMNYCSGCHELGYARYARTAEDLELDTELVEANMIFDGTSIGELMTNAMSDDDSKVWFGAAPPDLTLIGRVRKPDWLYTYMKSFYNDPSRPLGANNKLYANVGMPNALHNLQGDVVCDDHGSDDPTQCDLTHIEGTGSLTPEEFDATVADLVNFLYYIGEPIRTKRQSIGVWVLAFLALLYILVFFMSREFSKDYH
jgi:ubiquinol-cytochrome c reductase cytochrome b subunit